MDESRPYARWSDTATPTPGTVTATPTPGTVTATPTPGTVTATPTPGTVTATPTTGTVSADTGIIQAKAELNKLHMQLADQGFNQVTGQLVWYNTSVHYINK